MDNIREKLVELLEQCSCHYSPPCTGECYECNNVEMYDKEIAKIADHLLANGVTVQEMAYWTDVMDCGVGNCFGRCSNCLTLHKANSYAELVTGRRYCKWCGAKLLPPKGEENG